MGTERRLFLAVAISNDIRHGLAAFLSADGMPEIPGTRVPAENWHITLRFLGRSSTLQQDKVLAALDGNLDRGPFKVGFGGLGAFPYPAKATVVWLAVEHGRDHLVELSVACERAAVHAGYDPEERPFHPHLSLARVRPHQDVEQLLDEFPRFPGQLSVDTIVLYESISTANGVTYAELERVDL